MATMTATTNERGSDTQHKITECPDCGQVWYGDAIPPAIERVPTDLLPATRNLLGLPQKAAGQDDKPAPVRGHRNRCPAADALDGKNGR